MWVPVRVAAALAGLWAQLQASWAWLGRNESIWCANGVDESVSARNCFGGWTGCFSCSKLQWVTLGTLGTVSSGGNPFIRGDALLLGTKQARGAQRCCIRTSGTNGAHHPESGYPVLFSPGAGVQGRLQLFLPVLAPTQFQSSRECKYIATASWTQGLYFVQDCTMAVTAWPPRRLVSCAFVVKDFEEWTGSEFCSWFFLWEHSMVTDVRKTRCLLKLLLRNSIVQLA